MNKFTFKKHPKETGLFAIGYPYQSVDIKFKKKIVGIITAPSWQTKDSKWDVRFSVLKNDISEDGNLNCEWKWVRLARRFDSEENARLFLNEKIEIILDKFNLYSIEDKTLISGR